VKHLTISTLALCKGCSYVHIGCVLWDTRQQLGESEYKHVLANISRSHYNTRAVWTKWKGARSRRVDFIGGKGSLRRHA